MPNQENLKEGWEKIEKEIHEILWTANLTDTNKTVQEVAFFGTQKIMALLRSFVSTEIEKAKAEAKRECDAKYNELLGAEFLWELIAIALGKNHNHCWNKDGTCYGAYAPKGGCGVRCHDEKNKDCWHFLKIEETAQQNN